MENACFPCPLTVNGWKNGARAREHYGEVVHFSYEETNEYSRIRLGGMAG